MSSNGNLSTGPAERTSALNVGFSSVADRNGESSSRAASRSPGQRSHGSDERRERSMTPERGSKDRDRERDTTGKIAHRHRRSGGFLLESVFADGSPKGSEVLHGKQKAQNGQLYVDKRRLPSSRLSVDSTSRGSPLSREVSANMVGDGARDEPETSRQSSLDPTQLVQMALNLSESRRRHVSTSLSVPLTSPRRATSGPMSNYGTVRATSAAHRRASRMSHDVSHDLPLSRSGVLEDSDDFVHAVDYGEDNVLHTFSPATLARAEKARKYFELASEHRRLLQHLPPLKPDSTALGNYTFESHNSPGSAFPHIRRVQSTTENKHELSRQYNPIQSLRNRRVRIREKRPFTAPPESWADPEKVKGWVDNVEAATTDPEYRGDEDRTQLPTFSGEDDSAGKSSQEPTSRHRKTDTVGSVIMRPENSWTIEPTELLADAYWTEKGDNKAYVETRHGNTIFPSRARPSLDAPKISIDMHRNKDDQMSVDNYSDDIDDLGKPSRRRRLIMPLKGATERRKRILSRSPSTSSSSADEGIVSKKLRANGAIDYENIGPLERHMRELIEKDERGELSSPEMTAANHWDAKALPYHRSSTNNSHRDSLGRLDGRNSLEVPRDLHRRSKSADGRVNSFDRVISTDPSPSPLSSQMDVHSRGETFGQTLEGRRSLDAQRAQGSKLPSFRSNSRDLGRNISQVDFAEGGASGGAVLPPILSGDTWRPRASMEQESTRPKDVKRHQANDSLSNGLHRLDTSSTTGTFSSIKEPASTVGRLFKGGRDRLRTLRNKDKLDGLDGASRAVSDMSEAEDEVAINGVLRKRLTDSPGDESDVSPRASFERTRANPKYHLGNLPSFTSSARDKRLQAQTSLSNNDDVFKRQQKGSQEADKNVKADRPVPPRINVSQQDSTFDSEFSFNRPSIRFENRKSYGELHVDAPVSSRTISRSPGQRHWSIYDHAQFAQAEKITPRDIARVKALLLCSGIKAREIQRLADSTRERKSAAFEKAADTSGQRVEDVSMKDEHLVATQMLSNHLNSGLSTFEATLAHFQEHTAQSLASSLDELRSKAADHLTKLVHDTSDEADAFTVELTTRQPLQVKRVDDAVDAMIGQRRRQFRLLKSFAFKLLEWLVLSIMWWIWFMVYVFNTSKRVVLVVPRFLRWLFVF